MGKGLPYDIISPIYTGKPQLQVTDENTVVPFMFLMKMQ